MYGDHKNSSPICRAERCSGPTTLAGPSYVRLDAGTKQLCPADKAVANEKECDAAAAKIGGVHQTAYKVNWAPPGYFQIKLDATSIVRGAGAAQYSTVPSPCMLVDAELSLAQLD